jgi:hypothetical protein
VRISGDAKARLRLISEVTGHAHPLNWDWVKIPINKKASSGDDAGESALDFYSRHAPMGLPELSVRFPDLDFDCTLMDLSAEDAHYRTWEAGVITDQSDKDIEWLDGPPSENELLTGVANALGVSNPEAARLWEAFLPLREVQAAGRKE